MGSGRGKFASKVLDKVDEYLRDVERNGKAVSALNSPTDDEERLQNFEEVQEEAQEEAVRTLQKMQERTVGKLSFSLYKFRHGFIGKPAPTQQNCPLQTTGMGGIAIYVQLWPSAWPCLCTCFCALSRA